MDESKEDTPGGEERTFGRADLAGVAPGGERHQSGRHLPRTRKQGSDVRHLEKSIRNWACASCATSGSCARRTRSLRILIGNLLLDHILLEIMKEKLPAVKRKFKKSPVFRAQPAEPRVRIHLAPPTSPYILPKFWRRRKLRANGGVLSTRNAPERASSRRIRRAFSPRTKEHGDFRHICPDPIVFSDWGPFLACVDF